MAFDLRRFLPLAGSLVISTFFAGAALAQDAVTTGDVNMRAGPGTQFERLATLPAGTGVDIAGCSGSWCRVVHRGITGFVSRSFLDEDGVVAAPRRRYVEPPLYAAPRVYVEPPFYVDPPYYPSYRPGWRPSYRYDRPGFGPRPGWGGGGRPGWSGGGGRPGPGPGWSGGGGGRPGPGPGWSGGGRPGPGMGGGGGRPPGPGMGGGGGRPPTAQPGQRPPGMVPGFTGARPDRS
ncbi:MAG: SH3 domain-containing protein [Phreatobacter sp.]|uniref:SH3 domain-containing protein n=1 Tax=Phreatobacter sp. TaxID=1966341 RepID=UPI00273600F5|nr:SH3 domain-containing protein [Phreatobacter sp.]MDP2802375.1 SH3 domain-containing protein [Phreatobacter sp.]